MPKGFLRTALALVAATIGGAASADDARLVTRTYTIGALVSNVRPAAPPSAPTVTPVEATRLASQPVPHPLPQPVPLPPPEVLANAESLARVLISTVKPWSWADMGGAGSVKIDPATCSLIVAQTADVHAHVADLLASMRRVHTASTPQVLLELSVVEVPETFFESVGQDFDVSVKGEACPACSDVKLCQAMEAAHEADATKPPVALLSAARAESLMKCVQSHRRASVISRPQLVLTDLCQGSFQVGQETRFLTGLELTAGPNGLERKPRYRTVQLGTTIHATPKVSADHRFVELKLNYRSAQPVAKAMVTTVTVGDADTTEVLSAPAIDTHEIRANVAIPTGKTVLLAGPVVTREERTEFGMPVLTKVPHVNKLFANTGVGREKYRHLVLVTAKVLTPKGTECGATADCKACEASDCKSCPATTQTVAVAKPAVPVDPHVEQLMAAYHKACAEGRTEAAIRLAMQALSRDPKCFAND